ncbi:MULTISPECIES: AI-2E family transporter [unclassified Acidiphilium]|jgi:predicted PurR-regulated permease PerM|uniref:AI-2E family transporter n=1 Tax=unclassified Acidiphilium TaxID=2617493 RepID=UPI000BCDC47E|nr:MULTISPECIES: AI-2E family transporter [unclassified Acidiphilium]OYV55175.1 MAG: AI-2E family transporter [Acidiphilium sp. 20-67-58]HQT61493.1 AI-2E family transporter [Acidiphilium sp.]
MADPPPEERAGLIALALAAAAGLAICAALALPFLGALTWALVLAILFAPLQARVERRIPHRGLAAGLTVLVAILVVGAPATLVVERLAHGAIAGAAFIQARLAAEGPLRLPALAWLPAELDLSGLLGRLVAMLGNAGAALLRGSVAQVIEIVLAFYILFYALRDRAAAIASLRRTLPLDAAEVESLLARIGGTVQAIVYGTVMVAALQGTLAGLMFWALGLGAPLFWGIVMSLLAIVPVLGTFVVWIPEAAYLALEGQETKALILALWGALIVGEIDNVVRPILVGDRLRLPTVPVFIAIIGGLIVFGPPGFILGPLAMTLTLLALDLLRRRRGGPAP